ncbi:DUF4835 family protein [Sediminibacterium goheungense]|uniref:Uncharacterized protein DUF4835 n=1 Tax=Sediminibacterium goheungense TaxID=1086393 RepID=A0A4R6ISJ4_9BACT|nr:DUF4835 family protein [Sediminibacterium goheungense]TDO25450.1 uncharacterized protein DUF4835 [Sediminibacterium goheungense]
MYKKIIYILLFILTVTGAEAQELQARVTVLSNRVTTNIDRKIFNTLQNQLTNLLNNRKWTNDSYKQNEKIECSFILNIESVLETNIYKASLNIQAARPVYHSSYQAAMINFQDPDVAFKYVEFQPVEFNENRVQGTDATAANLTAVFAYYAYTILGLDYDSFAPKAGEPYFRKAQNIVNNAPEGRGISGWRIFDGLRNRYWLNENLINTRYNNIHDIIYGYYRKGLDNLYDKDAEARAGVINALIQLQSFGKENPNTMIQQFFMQGKYQELVGIFKKAPAGEKAKALELLSELDVINASKYKEELR